LNAIALSLDRTLIAKTMPVTRAGIDADQELIWSGTQNEGSRYQHGSAANAAMAKVVKRRIRLIDRKTSV
jgi:hypothetical protein